MRLDFGSMQFSRASHAWCPITGRRASTDVPRVVEDFILEMQGTPTIYHRFSPSQGFTSYSPTAAYQRPGETTDYFTGDPSSLLTQLIAAVPSATVLSLGTSYDGRDIPALRLGPTDRQHFLVTSVVHGNETDGLPGTLKAWEVLATHPDFARLRSDYTLFLIPCCNPDGFYAGTRGVAKLGPNPSGVDQQINLNRVWPWFWDEYVPSSSESKGAVPLDCPEATAIANWQATGNAGGPVPIRFALDQHSTLGDGARYQSRDRCMREIPEGDWLGIWAEWLVYRQLKAVQAKRVTDDGQPDLWINMFRSRFNPHLHPYWATRTLAENGGVAPISMVTEHNKVIGVEVDTDPETYESACNFNFDAVIACAQVMQGTTVPRTAVLIEHEAGNNQAQNSDFEQWQERTDPATAPDNRPGFWTPTRGRCARDNDRFLDFHGAAIELRADLSLQVTADQDLGPSNLHDARSSDDDSTGVTVVSRIATGGVAFWRYSQSATVGAFTQLFSDTAAGTSQCRLLHTGLAEFRMWDNNSGGNCRIIQYTSPSYARSVHYDFGFARDNPAVAWDGAFAYLIGGSVSSVDQTSVVRYDSVINTHNASFATLPAAFSSAEAVYCSGGVMNNRIVVVGGTNTSANVLRVVQITTAGGVTSTNLDVTGTELAEGLKGCALWYDGTDTVWVYGGERLSGPQRILQGVWRITFNGSFVPSVTAANLLAGLSDNQDTHEDDANTDPFWLRRWANWRAGSLVTADEGTVQVVLFGGVEAESDDGLSILAGPYRGALVHDVQDQTLRRPQDETFGYVRYNTAFATPVSGLVSTSWAMRALDETISGYVRLNNAPGDSVAGTLTTRRVRTYYMHPPRWWFWSVASLNLNYGYLNTTEDEWRAYVRFYRNDQPLLFDAPMIQHDTLWPSSWSPYGYTRQTETAIWADAVDPRYLTLKCVWQPPTNFLAVTSDVDVLTVVNGSWTITVTLVAGTAERSYNRYDVYGPHEPRIRISRTILDPGPVTESAELTLYWGGYCKDTALERFDGSYVLYVWQHPDVGCGLTVCNAGRYGTALIGSPLRATGAFATCPTEADVQIMGGGWWAEPERLLPDLTLLRQFAGYGERGAVLLGELDPTYGQVTEKAVFRYTDTFDRANNSNLGSDWDIISQTGNGWDIVGNRASCSAATAWERMNGDPGLRDCSIRGTVNLSGNNTSVGFFARLDWGTAYPNVNGYLGRAVIDGAGVTTLVLERLGWDGSTQTRTTLATASVAFPVASDFTLEFEVSGSTLTLTALTHGLVTHSDSTFGLPGAFGLCGECTGGTVTVNDVRCYTDAVIRLS